VLDPSAQPTLNQKPGVQLDRVGSRWQLRESPEFDQHATSPATTYLSISQQVYVRWGYLPSHLLAYLLIYFAVSVESFGHNLIGRDPNVSNWVTC
jgi:hypothetical protein